MIPFAFAGASCKYTSQLQNRNMGWQEASPDAAKWASSQTVSAAVGATSDEATELLLYLEPSPVDFSNWIWLVLF